MGQIFHWSNRTNQLLDGNMECVQRTEVEDLVEELRNRGGELICPVYHYASERRLSQPEAYTGQSGEF